MPVRSAVSGVTRLVRSFRHSAAHIRHKSRRRLSAARRKLRPEGRRDGVRRRHWLPSTVSRDRRARGRVRPCLARSSTPRRGCHRGVLSINNFATDRLGLRWPAQLGKNDPEKISRIPKAACPHCPASLGTMRQGTGLLQRRQSLRLQFVIKPPKGLLFCHPTTQLKGHRRLSTPSLTWVKRVPREPAGLHSGSYLVAPRRRRIALLP